MTHEKAKRLLEGAASLDERADAIEAALDMGMPLNEIEQFLDWLDVMRETPGCDPGDATHQEG
jgi:hypothetical protein